ncbi:hypothetical protein ACFFS2_36055 [Streptomyces aurantiacus]|nr:hypothetical protein [Streptomyces aurantiacus]
MSTVRVHSICGGTDLPHGQVIGVLVANRLTAPAPLFRVADWASA